MINDTATGTFDVQITPSADIVAADPTLGRMQVVKQFHGDLEAGSVGYMLTAMTDTRTSAAYVVVERVTGTLHGRQGSFALVHKGVMDRGAPTQDISVVPDSGTEDLVGLSGTLTIVIAGKQHSYRLEYRLDLQTS
jgi:hypothetical protein